MGRRCGLAGDPNYETGIRGEKAVQRSLQRRGFVTERAECSLGAADIRAVDPATGELFLVQVKSTAVEGRTPRISEAEKLRLRVEALRQGGTAVVALVRPGRRHRIEIL